MLQMQFGIVDLTSEALDLFTERDFGKENELVEAILQEDLEEFDGAGILLWVNNRTCYGGQHEKLVHVLKEKFGEDYQTYVAARRILYAADFGTCDLDKLDDLFIFLTESSSGIRCGESFASKFSTPSDYAGAMQKLRLHQKLSKDNSRLFYESRKICLFNIGDFSVHCERGCFYL